VNREVRAPFEEALVETADPPRQQEIAPQAPHLLRPGACPLKASEESRSAHTFPLHRVVLGRGAPILLIHGGPGLNHT